MTNWEAAYARWMAMPESERKGLNYSAYLWNDAIETAAQEVDDDYGASSPLRLLERIRALKEKP